MQITVGEAADALGVAPDSIGSWYTGVPKFKGPPWHALDTEHLCECLGFDHRFLMAFLTGYDIALSYNQIAALFQPRCDRWIRVHVVRKTEPVLIVRCQRGDVRLRNRRLVRYSYRRVAPLLAAHLEKQNGKHRAYTHGGGSLLPAPDLMPPDSFSFRSALTTEGTRLPWARRSVLEDGSASTLPIPDRGV